MAERSLVGSRVGQCRLEALVGSGGAGKVYRARHLTLDRVVAVKIMEPDEVARVAAFSEARAAAKLDDPRIVAIYEVGEDAGRPYIVMQWVDGETLEARVRRAGPLAPAEALAVMRETLGALAVAHEAGLVHRDVKPGNILLPSKGGVKLADFGLALAVGQQDGGGVGTYQYMPPEQGYGGALDGRADLYALGGTWHFALTGQAPFGEELNAALMGHREQLPPDTAALRPGVTRRNAELIARLLAKNPEDRPASAAAVLQECGAYGFLLETAAHGRSPFELVMPPAPPAPAAPEPPEPATLAREGELARAARGVPPIPPPPPPPAADRPNPLVPAAVLGVFALAASDGRAASGSPEDWLAASLAGGLALAALSRPERAPARRKAAGAAAWLLTLLCAARYAGGGPTSLESAALAGLGAACGAAALYLGLWGQDRQETQLARLLSPLGALLLLAAAVSWRTPSELSWPEGLASRALAAWESFLSSGGAWRWAALLGIGVSFLARRPAPPKERSLNWNR